MNNLEDQLTNAFDQRGAAVNVNDRLDDIVDGTSIVRFDAPPTRHNRRLLSAAAAVVLLAAGTFAVARFASPDELRDNANSTQPEAPEGAVVFPAPLSSVTELADDEWVVPSTLPDGYEFQYAANTSDRAGSSQMVLFGVGTSQIEQIVLNRYARASDTPGEPFDVDGTEWTVNGNEGSRIATRRVGDDEISVGGFPGNDTELTAMLGDLVVVKDAGLPQAPIAFGESMTEVATFNVDDRELTVRADGSNGWFCTTLAADSGSDGGCAFFFDPANHLQDYYSGGASYADGSTEVLASTYGLTSATAARIDVEWIDGTITSVTPQNTSARFPDIQFWATGATLELDGRPPEAETVVEVRAYDADGDLLATSRNGTLTVE